MRRDACRCLIAALALVLVPGLARSQDQSRATGVRVGLEIGGSPLDRWGPLTVGSVGVWRRFVPGLEALVAAELGNVDGGPFLGMKIPEDDVWFDATTYVGLAVGGELYEPVSSGPAPFVATRFGAGWLREGDELVSSMGSPTVSRRPGRSGVAVTAALDLGLRIAGEGRWPGLALFAGTRVIAPRANSYSLVLGAALSH